MGSSLSQRSFRSVTIAESPDTKHCLPATDLISLMASIVTSADVELSKKTAIKVDLSVLNAS